MTTSPPTATTSQSAPAPLNADDFNLNAQEADAYAVARIRDSAFEAVHTLWRKRQAEGMTQKNLAAALKRDTAWVSRALRGPGNWEFKTFARLVRALDGEAEIAVRGIEEPLDSPSNYHAYKDYEIQALNKLRDEKNKPVTSPSSTAQQKNLLIVVS